MRKGRVIQELTGRFDSVCVSHLLRGDKGKQWLYHLYPAV